MNRLNDSFLLLLLPGTLFLCGCKNEDPKLLTRLVQEIESNVTRNLGGAEELPKDERYVVVHRHFFQGEAQIVEDFLAKNPKLSNRSLNLVNEFLNVSKRGFDFYDKHFQAGNFALTEGEKLAGKSYYDQSTDCLRRIIDIARDD